MNSRVLLVAAREIRARLQQRGFRIGVAVTVLAIVVVAVLPKVLGSSSTSYDIAVTGGNTAADRSALTTVARARHVSLHLHDATATTAAAKVRSGDWDAALLDDRRILAASATGAAATVVQQAHQLVAVRQRLAADGVGPDRAAAALDVAALPVTATTSPHKAQRQAIATLAVIVLFAQLITYCTWVASGVVEEKASRVVELLLAAVRPLHLLAGKLVGIGALAVGQVALIAVAAVVAGGAAGTLALDGDTYAAVGIAFACFVLGFAVFAALAAGLAATVSRQEELSGVLSPMNIVLTGCYLASFYAAGAPDSKAAEVLSIVPPVSALAMPARIARGAMPGSQVALAVALLVVLAVVILLAAARVYRAAVLHTGRRVSLRRAWSGEAITGVAGR